MKAVVARGMHKSVQTLLYVIESLGVDIKSGHVKSGHRFSAGPLLFLRSAAVTFPFLLEVMAQRREAPRCVARESAVASGSGLWARTMRPLFPRPAQSLAIS
jgi:hypothetical protein